MLLFYNKVENTEDEQVTEEDDDVPPLLTGPPVDASGKSVMLDDQDFEMIKKGIMR